MNRIARVFIVDFDPPSRMAVGALAARLGYPSTEFSDIDQVFAAIEEDPRGCVVLELVSPHAQGIEVLRQITTTTGLPVIVGSFHPTVAMAVEAMQNGAMTVIEKPYPIGQLGLWLRQAMAVAPQVVSEARRKRELKLRLDRLHPRERLAVRMFLDGEPNKTVARRLGVGRRTVDRIRANVLEKLGADSTVKLARLLGESSLLCAPPLERVSALPHLGSFAAS